MLRDGSGIHLLQQVVLALLLVRKHGYKLEAPITGGDIADDS